MDKFVEALFVITMIIGTVLLLFLTTVIGYEVWHIVTGTPLP